MAEVPEVFNQPGAAFVLIRTGIKFPPIEYGWQLPENAHAFDEARAHNGNIGVLAGNGFLGLDQDKPDAFEGLALPITTMWETRPGRFGLWFTYKDSAANALAKYSKKPEQAQLKLFKDGKPVGEVKLQRTYQVIPPSWKSLEDGQRADYRLLTGSTPAEISLTWLLSELQRIGITFGSKLEQNAARLESMTRNARKARAETDDQRARRYAEAALEGEIENVRSAPKGHRNDQLNKSSYVLGQFVAAGLLSASEVTRALEAVAEDDEPEKIRPTIRSGLEAGARHPRETATTGREALKAALKADPEDPAALEELSRLSPIGAAKLLGEAKLPKGVTSALVLKEADRLRKAQRAQPEAEEEPGPDPSTMEKALTIAKEGDPLRFLVWQAQRNHLGDINYQKVLICSIASAASLTSNGIQPGSTGDKGSGKSDACVAAYHLIPRDRILEGSLSPMSLLYLGREGRLKPGMVLFSDDVEYEPIVPIFKRSTSAFQRTVRHFTVLGGKEKRAEVLEIPPRFVWWLTSVESVANDQAFDRQYPISTDSSPGHKKRVAAEIANRRSRRETKLAEDEGVLVARALLTDIFDNGPFKVVIPQAEGAEWVRSSDFRGQEQFWDLVDALTILRWRQRQMDRDGYLMAEDVDVLDAKELMMAHKQSHVLDLTEAEIALVGVLLDGLPRTQKELCEALGLSQSTVSTRLGTIMKKSPAITEDTHQGRKTYQINKEFDLSTGYWENLELIRFKHDLAKQASGGVIGGLSVCYRTLIGIPIGIVINNSDGIPGSLSVITGGVSKAECLSCLAGRVGEKACEIYSSAKRPITNQNQQQEKPIRTDNAPPIEPITCQNQQQETSIEVDNSTDNASSKPHTDINEELAEADRTSPPTTSETGCKCDPSTFLKANVALTFASRDLQRFSALTLAGKSRTPPGEVLRFLQAARALGLAEVTELGTKRADRLDLWAWREPPPGPAGHKEGVTA